MMQPLPAPFDAPICWAKADMIATVAFRRLELFRTARDPGGRRQYLRPRLSGDDLKRVRAATLLWPLSATSCLMAVYGLGLVLS